MWGTRHSADPAVLVAATRKSYQGPLEAGQDLMTINIGEQIEVKRPEMR